MKKYNVFKNAKELLALRPTKYEFSILLITLFIGLYFYQYHSDAEAILGFASFVLVSIVCHFIAWSILFGVHCFICYKKKVNFFGKSKDDD